MSWISHRLRDLPRHISSRTPTGCLYLLQSVGLTTSPSKAGAWPVLIVGGGPTGLTLSCLLSQLQIRNLVLERSSSLSTHPQAHFINCRTMEIFSKMPSDTRHSLAADVEAACPPLDHWRKFVYCVTMCGHKYGEVDHFKGQKDSVWHGISPQGVAHLSQNKLLPLLMRSAHSMSEFGTILMGHKVHAMSQQGNTVRLDVEGPEGMKHVEGSFVVGADGARSKIRSLLGIPMEGPAVIQELVNIHFLTPSLGKELRDSNPAMLYFVFNQEAVVVVVAHDLQQGEFVAQVPIFSPMQSLKHFTEAKCKQIVNAACGKALPDVKIKSIKTWAMGAQVAKSFQDGQVFLAGDAAHHFPPAGGFGMNTGIQDAHNLAWKLAQTIDSCKGTADSIQKRHSSLLLSYTTERKQIAEANTALSKTNFEEALKIPAALGLSRDAANILSSAASLAYSVVPAFGRSLLNLGLLVGHQTSGADGPWKSWRRKNLDSIFRAGASLRLQFPREDLGFVYSQPGAFVSVAGRDQPANSAKIARTDGHGRDAPYHPVFEPGARMPHVAVYKGNMKGSLLDLTGASWLLLLPALKGSDSWIEAACTVVKGCSTRIKILLISEDSANTEQSAGTWDSQHHCQIETLVVDTSQGQTSTGLVDAAAILVRPDGHIAWVYRRHSLAQPSPEATQILQQVFWKFQLKKS